MEENTSPRRIRWPDRYDRVGTLEVEDQAHTTTTSTESELRTLFHDLNVQMQSACNVIDWDRIFMTALATISLVLVVFAFFPYLQTQIMTDQQFQHLFVLKSLTISEFQVAPDRVTGKCDVRFNISNLGERSIYHETSVMSIFLDHELLWVSRTGDFFISVGDYMLFNVTINTTDISVPASFVPTALIESRSFHKPLMFKIKYDGMVREGLAAWYEERTHVYVICGWVEMRFINETTLRGGPANCTLENS
ncbi:hypothetical protein AAHA92_18846 [Salvia divinorum]|uniref:Late embryogenesis abundant protein LEA-2 subgroup domain-containing protein n=1 Tax=Salvia divinorum TaxID=28513 RepID=A0ABD1H7L3_SALDI